MKNSIVRAPQFDNSDHAFAQYLRAKDWTTTSKSDGNVRRFFNDNGALIAIATYDNTQSTYTVELTN